MTRQPYCTFLKVFLQHRHGIEDSVRVAVSSKDLKFSDAVDSELYQRRMESGLLCKGHRTCSKRQRYVTECTGNDITIMR